MNAADQIFATDVTIGQERAAVQAAPVEHRHVVVEPDNYEVNVADERVRGGAIGKVIPACDAGRAHGLTLSRLRQANARRSRAGLSGSAAEPGRRVLVHRDEILIERLLTTFGDVRIGKDAPLPLIRVPARTTG